METKIFPKRRQIFTEEILRCKGRNVHQERMFYPEKGRRKQLLVDLRTWSDYRFAIHTETYTILEQKHKIKSHKSFVGSQRGDMLEILKSQIYHSNFRNIYEKLSEFWWYSELTHGPGCYVFTSIYTSICQFAGHQCVKRIFAYECVLTAETEGTSVCLDQPTQGGWSSLLQ